MTLRLHKGFLKHGDPALTHPHGLDRSTPLKCMNRLGGEPMGPESEDPVEARARAWREWEGRLPSCRDDP